MAVLVRAPEAVENSIRKSAEQQDKTLNSWWVEAAEEKLQRERWDVQAIANAINSDPVAREVLDRLAK